MKPLVAIAMALFVVSCGPGSQPPLGSATDGPHAADHGLTGGRESSPPPAEGSELVELVSPSAAGQSLYVPVYSHVYYGHDKRSFNLACTLSIRNTDTRSPITLTAVDYYDTGGSLVRAFIDGPRPLGPLETTDFYVPERDTTGGSGANFIVRWSGAAAVDAPVVEAVMIGVAEGQGISFVSPARELTE